MVSSGSKLREGGRGYSDAVVFLRRYRSGHPTARVRDVGGDPPHYVDFRGVPP